VVAANPQAAGRAGFKASGGIRTVAEDNPAQGVWLPQHSQDALSTDDGWRSR